ncbi:MBG domain-containing protein, partial [Treponema sp. R6D11]
ALTSTITGFAPGEDITSLTGKLTQTVEGSIVGKTRPINLNGYAITSSGYTNTNNPNYNIIYAQGLLKVDYHNLRIDLVSIDSTKATISVTGGNTTGSTYKYYYCEGPYESYLQANSVS